MCVCGRPTNNARIASWGGPALNNLYSSYFLTTLEKLYLKKSTRECDDEGAHCTLEYKSWFAIRQLKNPHRLTEYALKIAAFKTALRICANHHKCVYTHSCTNSMWSNMTATHTVHRHLLTCSQIYTRPSYIWIPALSFITPDNKFTYKNVNKNEIWHLKRYDDCCTNSKLCGVHQNRLYIVVCDN